jgi:uncharacterized membrane protein YfcA
MSDEVRDRFERVNTSAGCSAAVPHHSPLFLLPIQPLHKMRDTSVVGSSASVLTFLSISTAVYYYRLSNVNIKENGTGI